jgi:hypothetical protein
MLTPADIEFAARTGALFEESERRRASGESFTKADYLAWMNRKN